MQNFQAMRTFEKQSYLSDVILINRQCKEGICCTRMEFGMGSDEIKYVHINVNNLCKYQPAFISIFIFFLMSMVGIKIETSF